jgi:hypothetical protein
MKSFNRLIASLFLIVISFVSLLAQSPQTNKVETQTIKSFNENKYKEWQKIKLKSLSFYTPKELKEKKVNCYEGGCYTFESSILNLHIDINYDAFRPSYERSYSDYKENIYSIDEGKVWSWFYENKERSKYTAGALFYLSKPKEKRVGIYLDSNDKKVYEIAEKIFKSVKFDTQ